MTEKSKTPLFELIVTAVFGVLVIGGFFGFAIVGKRSKTTNVQNAVPLVVWGTLPRARVAPVFEDLQANSATAATLTYVEKNKKTFSQDFVNALALGAGPDLLLTDHETILYNRDKIIPLSYTTLSKAQYQSFFVPAANIFLYPEGELALPLFLDPLVLFYNQNLARQQGVKYPPKSWKNLEQLAPTIRRTGSNITSALIPLGAYNNYAYAKELLVSIYMQLGSTITGYQRDTDPKGPLGQQVISGLEGYVNYANPDTANPLYTWNNSLLDATAMFISGRLLYYPAFASESQILKTANPNLVLGAALLPQVSENTSLYGTVYALAITRQANDPVRYVAASQVLINALQLLQQYTNPIQGAAEPLADFNARVSRASAIFENQVQLPLATALFSTASDSSAMWKIFVDSSKYIDVWNDFDSEQTRQIFVKAIRSVVTGALSTTEALAELTSELKNLNNN